MRLCEMIFGDVLSPIEDRVDRPPEHALALAVDDADLVDTAGATFVQIGGHEIGDVARREGVEIEDAVDRELYRVVTEILVVILSHVVSSPRGRSGGSC
jgi:hypothetical protein